MYISEQQMYLKTNFLLHQQCNIQMECLSEMRSGLYPPGHTKIPSVAAAGQLIQLRHFYAKLENWYLL